MSSPYDNLNLSSKLAGCLAQIGKEQHAAKAEANSAIHKLIKRQIKRETRWSKKLHEGIEKIEKQVERKGIGSALHKLFFRPQHRQSQELLRLLKELHKRDAEQYADLTELLHPLFEGDKPEVTVSPAGAEAPRSSRDGDQPTVVMVDLRGLDASGVNGGLQTYIKWLIPWLIANHRRELLFLAIASWSNYELVASLLSREDSVVVEADHHQTLASGDDRGPMIAATALPLNQLAVRMEVDVLYCPLGPLAFQGGGIRSIALIADLLHRELPHALPASIISLRDRYIKRAVAEATWLQCISHSGQERLEHHYPDAVGKAFFTYLPVQERFSTLPPMEQDTGNVGRRPYFFYPANFWPHKNHRILLVAYQLYVHEAGSGAWDLVLSGSDYQGEAAEIVRLAGSLGLTDKVRITGYVSEIELSRLWMHAGALVFPSLHEGFGIPLLEAMHYKVPILTAPDYSLIEVAQDAALYFNPRKPEQIAARMKELAGNPALANELRRKGEARLSSFNAEEEAQRLVSALTGKQPVSPPV